MCTLDLCGRLVKCLGTYYNDDKKRSFRRQRQLTKSSLLFLYRIRFFNADGQAVAPLLEYNGYYRYNKKTFGRTERFLPDVRKFGSLNSNTEPTLRAVRTHCMDLLLLLLSDTWPRDIVMPFLLVFVPRRFSRGNLHSVSCALLTACRHEYRVYTVEENIQLWLVQTNLSPLSTYSSWLFAHRPTTRTVIVQRGQEKCRKARADGYVYTHRTPKVGRG